MVACPKPEGDSFSRSTTFGGLGRPLKLDAHRRQALELAESDLRRLRLAAAGESADHALQIVDRLGALAFLEQRVGERQIQVAQPIAEAVTGALQKLRAALDLGRELVGFLPFVQIPVAAQEQLAAVEA